VKIHEEADPLEAKNLFNLEGQKWKEVRSKLSPTFTSGKMKMMTPLIEEVAKRFQEHLTRLAKNKEEFEAKVM
jgi:cytochrome P450 family 6